MEAAAVPGVVRDLDTGEILSDLIWFDVEAGTFEQLKRGRDGQLIPFKDGHLTSICKGHIRLENSFRVEGSPAKCAECSRPAKWKVGDETPLEPEKRKGVEFVRARTVGVRHYCDWCYKGPRILDAKGELMEVIEGGARPQWHS